MNIAAVPIESQNLLQAQRQTAGMPVWAIYIFVFSVFSKEIGHFDLLGIDYDLIGYNYCLFHLLYYIKDLHVNRKIATYYLFLLVAGIISKLSLDLPFGPFWKQFIPIVIIYSVCYDVMRRVNYQLLFRIYYNIAFYAAIFGFIQFIVKATTGIRLLTQYGRLFIDSIAYEPSHYVVLMMPAAIYGIIQFRENKLKSIVVNASVIFTFTSTAIISYTIMIAMLFQGFFYLLLIVPVLYFIFTTYLVNIEFLQYRLTGFLDYFEHQNVAKIQSATSLSFLSNAEVAISSVNANPLFGVGLGGHEAQYFRHFKGTSFSRHYIFGINAPSGHNLLIRIISETGLIGTFLYLSNLIKGLLFTSTGIHRIIAISCFSHFISRALKLGGFIDYGTPFFVMIMFFNYIDYKSLQKNDR